MTAQRYAVGQVLFVLSDNKILPAQVIEENTRKTLQGDVVSYKVIFGIEPKNVMELDKVKGTVYTSLHDVKDFLLDNVTKWVNQQVAHANKASLAWYRHDALEIVTPAPVMQEIAPEPSQAVQSLPDNPNDVSLVTMPDGRQVKARVRMSKEK